MTKCDRCGYVFDANQTGWCIHANPLECVEHLQKELDARGKQLADIHEYVSELASQPFRLGPAALGILLSKLENPLLTRTDE